MQRTEPTGVDHLPALVAAESATLGHAVHIAHPRSDGRIGTNIWEQSWLPWIARGSVLVSLANSGPVLARRHVVMIHDLSPWDHPEWFSRPYRLKATLLAYSWARWSSLVLTPSQFTADRCHDVLGIERSRMIIVGNAHRWGDPVPERTQPDGPYVLTVSTLSTRKNLDYLLKVWPGVRERFPDLRLRVVGARATSLLVGDDGAASINNRHVDYLGYVTEDELDGLLLGATAVVSASRYEGFNIPILDALVAGVPVAASDIPIHRELYGDGAQFFDLDDPSTVVPALANAIADPVGATTRDAYRDHFSPTAVVQRVIDAIEERFSPT